VRSVVIQVTGLADAASPELGGQTPLEAADTPVLDELASRGILGLMRTVPEGGLACTSAATAGILGLDSQSDLPAPGAITAAALDVVIPPGMGAACLDLIAIAEQEGGGPALVETCFPELTPDDGVALARALDEAVEPIGARVHAGVGASHVLVCTKPEELVLQGPPDRALGRTLADVLPGEGRGAALRTFMSRARAALWEHPVCVRLRGQGVAAPTDVWPWGAGPAGTLPAFVDHFGVRGASVVLAPLPRGVARLCGVAVEPAGVTSGDTSLAARVERALALSAEYEFVLLHVEGVDQAGPRGHAASKVAAITRLDAEVLGPILAGLRAAGGDWRLAVVADVTSSSAARCYTADPVPFVVASPRDAGRASAPRRRCTERDAREQGIFLGEAHTLLERLLRR
jgi:2,3-bisphosphoglycerate-independent phosphoglycerate mutase